MLSKDKLCSIPMNVLISRNSLQEEKKLVLSQNKRSHNLESFGRNYKKFVTQSGTSLLINCGKLLVCHPKNGGVLDQKVALE